MNELEGCAMMPPGESRPDLRATIREASQALALLDAKRLEELAVSCRVLNGAVSSREVEDAAAEMAILGRVLDATGANLKVMRRLREVRAGRIEYGEEQARGWTAENVHGKH